MTRISHGVEISIVGGVGEMVCAYLLVGFFFFFFFFFCNHVFIVVRYKKLHAALAMAKTKPINNNHDPLHLFMGKIKYPESIGNVPPAYHLR